MGVSREQGPLQSPDGQDAEFFVLVPNDATPGVTKMTVEISPEKKLVFPVPAEVKPGEKLHIQKSDNTGQWTCKVLRQISEARKDRGQEDPPHPTVAPNNDEPMEYRATDRRVGDVCREFSLFVPADAVPGKTQLQVQVSDVSDDSVVVKVPDAARPGDRIVLTEDVKNDRWNLTLYRTEKIPEGSGGAAPIKLLLCPVDPVTSYARMVEAARLAGAHVSVKLERANIEDLGMVGIVASESIEQGEELLRVPAALHISNKTVQAVEPDLCSALRELPGLLPRLKLDAGKCTFLAKLIGEALERYEAEERGETVARPPVGSVESLWAYYCDALLGEDFRDHPYWRSLDVSEEVKAILHPSHEAEHATVLCKEFVSAGAIIAQRAPQELLGPHFDAGRFLQARLCMLTRAFDCGPMSACVPVVDLMNHSNTAGARWGWDEAGQAMVVTATRAHAPGEQVCISYGNRPNPLLFRTYGFTLPPDCEHSWSYILQGKKPREIYNKYLPQRLSQLNINFNSKEIEDFLVEALNAVHQEGHDAADFIRDLCTHCREAYHSDPLLQAPLAALSRVRARDPTSGAWWTEMCERDMFPRSEPNAAWKLACMRVKMSEYLSLTAHIEVADFLSGRLTEDKCLAAAVIIRRLLTEAYDQLRKHGRFQIERKPI